MRQWRLAAAAVVATIRRQGAVVAEGAAQGAGSAEGARIVFDVSRADRDWRRRCPRSHAG